MRDIAWTSAFKRDFKREKKKNKTIEQELAPILFALRNEQLLEAKHCDHALTGKWHAFRDCHIKPDVLLIYQKTGDNILLLVRLGSHSTLGL